MWKWKNSADFCWKLFVKPWLKIFYRDHDRGWKTDMDQSNLAWKISGNLDWRFLSRLWLINFHQTLIWNFQPDLDWKIPGRLWLKISNQTLNWNRGLWKWFRREICSGQIKKISIRSRLENFEQTLIDQFPSNLDLEFSTDLDCKIPGRLWLQFLLQTLIEIFSSRSWSWLKNWSGSIVTWLKIFRQTLIESFWSNLDWKIFPEILTKTQFRASIRPPPYGSFSYQKNGVNSNRKNP